MHLHIDIRYGVMVTQYPLQVQLGVRLPITDSHSNLKVEYQSHINHD
jgi:hypothetical protein